MALLTPTTWGTAPVQARPSARVGAGGQDEDEDEDEDEETRRDKPARCSE